MATMIDIQVTRIISIIRGEYVAQFANLPYVHLEGINLRDLEVLPQNIEKVTVTPMPKV